MTKVKMQEKLLATPEWYGHSHPVYFATLSAKGKRMVSGWCPTCKRGWEETGRFVIDEHEVVWEREYEYELAPKHTKD